MQSDHKLLKLNTGLITVEVSGLSVRTALDLSSLRRGVPEVQTGKFNLDRPVMWAHTGEVSDIASLLAGGELLLTTGMGISDKEAAQSNFVKSLAERGVSALVLELGATFRHTPAAMVAEAERQGFPLIALHREIPFIKVTKQIHEHIINHQFAAIRSGEDFAAKVATIAMDGGGVPEVLELLSTTLGNPVLLETEGNGVVYSYSGSISAEDLAAAWMTINERLPSAPTWVSVQVPAPDGGSWGRLVCVEMSAPHCEFTKIAFEHAARIVGLLMVRRHEQDRLSLRARGDFLGEILEPDMSPAEIESVARQQGIRLEYRESLLPIVAVSRPGTYDGNEQTVDWAPIWQVAGAELTKAGFIILAGILSGDRRLLLLSKLSATEDRNSTANRISRAIHAATANHVGVSNTITIWVGAARSTWSGAAEEMRSAIEDSSGAAPRPQDLWCDLTQPNLDLLLEQLSLNPVLERYVEKTLRPLIDKDARSGSELLYTLEVFCDCGGNKTEAARSLHLKRQSLYSRLDRIEKLMEVDLSEPSDLLGVSLAVRARSR